MNIVEIPTKFELARCKHIVNVLDHLYSENFGDCCNSNLTINIARNSKRLIITKDRQLNTFYHELVHAILYAIERDDLNENETFITNFGNMLMEFDLTRDNIPHRVIETSMCFVDDGCYEELINLTKL